MLPSVNGVGSLARIRWHLSPTNGTFLVRQIIVAELLGWKPSGGERILGVLVVGRWFHHTSAANMEQLCLALAETGP